MKSQWIQLAAWLAAASTAIAQTSAPRPDLNQLLDQWRAEHGAGWKLDVDEGTGHLEMLYGARVAPAFKPSNDADWFTLARSVLATTQPMHGIAGHTLVEHHTMFLGLGQFGSSDKVTVRFRQELNGVPVDAGFVNVLFDAQGGLLSIQERALPLSADLLTRSALTLNTAAEYARAAFDADFADRTPTSVTVPALVIAQVEGIEERTAVLSWKVDVLSEDPDLGAVGKTYWIDAANGRVAKSENAIHHFDVGGTVYTKASPNNYPDIVSNPATQHVAKYARVTSASGTRITDANGNFNYAGVTGPLSVTVFYDGTYNDVNNSAGAAYSLVASLTGTGNSVVMNNTPSALVTSQSNVFVACSELRDFVRSVNSGDGTADFVMTSNVNIASTCNAYFNGSSTNYYQAGGGCPSTAFQNVAMHENGHWLNVLYGTGNGSDGMGEGNADVFAMYYYDDPVVGHDFCGTGCNVRNGLNTTQFCGDANPGCHGGVHADGEVWGGAVWKTRRNLKTALGVGPGGALANALFFDWMLSYNQTQIKTINETQWLTLDDDDANLGNGTPHYTQINDAFEEQGFPGYDLELIQYTNVTDLPDTTNQVGPYVVNATITSVVGSITSATLRWRVGSSGVFSSTAMNPIGGNVWSASLAGVAAPAKVYYYLQATDSAANAANYPDDAPVGKLFFGVGSLTAISCDNFDTDTGWTVANTSVTTGAWERADPIGSGGPQSEVDNPAGTGVQCYFTDQGVVGGAIGDADVDGGPTTLTSPVINLSNGNGEIAYAYWMYNDDGDDSLLVQVSNNGSTWVTAKTYLGGGGGWVSDVVDVGSWIVPNATVRIRFQVADQPNDSITEAAIDDVCASTFGPVACPGATTYCTAKVNSQGCTPAVATSGTASSTNASPFNISVTQVLNNKSILLFYGFGANAAPFQGGTMCVQTPVTRTPLSVSGGNVGPDDCSGSYTYDFNARIQSNIDPNLVTGANVYAEFFYRDPASTFTVGLSNAAQFQICP